MAKENISARTRASGSGGGARALRDQTALLVAAQQDIATLRTQINLLTAKLDADAGVTDTNYTSLCGVPVLNLQP